MRTLINIPDKQLSALAEIAKQEKLPRAVVVRAAIAVYMQNIDQKNQSMHLVYGEKRKQMVLNINASYVLNGKDAFRY